MSLFSKFQKTNKELEPLVMAVANNAANNYKDAAQKAYKEFIAKFEELHAAGKLTEKQFDYYDAQKARFAMELKNFHH